MGVAPDQVLIQGEQNDQGNVWVGADDWNITYNNQSDGESTKATAYPTAFPTSHPTEAAYQDKCMNGQTEVDYGWHGAGAGDNWCNLCKCSRMTHSSDPANRAALHCQKKICQTKTDFGQICSHTKCHFVYNFEAQHRVMMVSSHHAEQNGKNHACAFNPRDNACECRCSGALSTEHLNMQKSSFTHTNPAGVTGVITEVRSGMMEHFDASADPICLDNQRRKTGTPVIRECLDSVTKADSNTPSDTW